MSKLLTSSPLLFRGQAAHPAQAAKQTSAVLCAEKFTRLGYFFLPISGGIRACDRLPGPGPIRRFVYVRLTMNINPVNGDIVAA